MSLRAAEPNFPADAVRAELARVLASSEFTASRHLTNFLTYIVEEALAGRTERLKERNIALGALRRGNDFDSRIDCIVRVEASKLRRALERYYGTRGASGPLCIDLPVGSYVPAFRQAIRGSALARPEPKRTTPVAADIARTTTGRPILVVVPFVPLTSGAEEQVVAALLSAGAAVRLSRLSWLEVVDELAILSTGVDTDKPRAVAARLRADFALSGTTGRIGDRIRLTVRLIDVRTGVLSWAEQFECSFRQEWSAPHDKLLDDIVGRVGDLFGVLAATACSHARTRRDGALTATEAVLASFQYQYRFDTGTFPRLLRALERAVLKSPDFAWSWIALGALHLYRMCGIGTRKSADEPRRSLDCIRRALQIDPTCSYGHFLLGIHHLFRNHAGQARGCAERALELALGMPFETGAAGLLLSLTGERERGERLILQARRINPRLPGWIHWDGDHLFENLRDNGRRMDEKRESLCSRAELRL